MLVALIEILQPTDPVSVDYLQGGIPADVFVVETTATGDMDVYAVVSENGPTIRFEQTDLVAHNYIVYSPDALPAVISMSDVRSELRLPALADALPQGEYSWTVEGADSEVSGTVHLLVRENHLVFSAEADGVVLVTQ